MRYKGLKFDNVFQSDDFVFMPALLPEVITEGIPIYNDFHSCKYDGVAEFYVLLISQEDENLEAEQQLSRFKFLEGILMFLFSNKITRISLFTLQIQNNEITLKKVIKYPQFESEDEHPPLKWKNIILLDFLKQILNNCFNKFKEIPANQVDFAEEFYFSIEMYLRGKHSEEAINIITSLWISLEIFSTISIIYLFNTDSNLIKSGLGKYKKCILKLAPYFIKKEESDCWEPLKENYYDHIVNKITPHLPIKQKIKLLVNEKLENDNISLPVSITYDYLINYFYVNRNNVVHNGKLPKIEGIELNRKQALFSMLIERLIVKILGFQKMVFYQIGDHQYLLMKFEGDVKEHFGYYSGPITTYIYTKLFPFSSFEEWETEEYIDQDIKIRNYFNEINTKYRSYIIKLNEINSTIRDLFSSNINLEISLEGTRETFSVQFEEFLEGKLKFKNLENEERSFFKYTNAMIEEIKVRFQSIENSNFTIAFSGYIKKIKREHLIVKLVPNQLIILINN